MGKSVTEAHRELYHYTTGSGLQGIVASQQLRATSIAYLNDAEEHTGFFDRRLPHLLDEPIRTAVAEIASTQNGARQIEERGGSEKAVKVLNEDLVGVLRSTTLKLDNPYVTAFCSALPTHDPNDGLLSQWRGYGTDSGYAIVLGTDELQELMDEEVKCFHYQFAIWGDVEYYDQHTSQKAAHLETLERERIVQQTIRDFILTNKQDVLGGLGEHIAALSCMHKHRGFSEEAEVRIVAVPTNAKLFALAQTAGDKRPKKPVEFAMKQGVLVPFIMLFGRQLSGDAENLPIRRVIVGPHPDKLKRKKSVELMLEEHGIDANVTVSDIPYLGR